MITVSTITDIEEETERERGCAALFTYLKLRICMDINIAHTQWIAFTSAGA